jgi:hypothetical protein
VQVGEERNAVHFELNFDYLLDTAPRPAAMDKLVATVCRRAHNKTLTNCALARKNSRELWFFFSVVIHSSITNVTILFTHFLL